MTVELEEAAGPSSLFLAADELMVAFAAAHALFSDRFEGVNVSVPVDDRRFVAFGFCARRIGFDVYEGPVAIPLSSAPLALRIRLVDLLPALWEACAAHAADTRGALRCATVALRAFIDSKEET